MPHIAGFRGVLASAPTERDPVRSVYRYHQRFAGPGRTFERKNVILAVAMTAYSEGMIRPHELAAPASRDAELARLRSSKAQIEPILFGFRDPATEVDRLFKKAESGSPTAELTTPDGTQHRLWRVEDAEVFGKLRNYFVPRKLHLLAGHDRYEARLAYRDELAAKAPLLQYSSANYALGCLVNLDDPTLATAPRHRIVRGPHTVDTVLATARTHFIIEKLGGAARDIGRQQAALADTVAHQPAFVVVFSGTADAYKLTLSPDVSAFSEGATTHRALQKLDPVVVEGLFVGRAMVGSEVTTTTNLEQAIATLDTGAAAIVVMRPLSIEQIAHVDEIGQLLPAGSTAIHPPMAPLVGMPIDPDEDLV